MSDRTVSNGLGVFTAVHEAVARLRGISALAFAALLGAFAALGFAPFHLSPALVISYTGLVWMLDGARGHRRWGKAVFLRAWAFGVGFFLISMHWTAAPFLVNPEKHLILIWMPLVLLPSGLALIWGAALTMGAAFWSASPSRIFIFAVFLAFGEFVRGHLFGGFPWNLPGTTWVPGGALSQSASIGGVYWLTLMTVFAVSAPAALVDTRDARGLVLRILPTFGAVVLCALAWAWGAQRIATPSPLSEQGIVVMDAGVPQREFGQSGPDPILSEYLRMLTLPESEPGDIVIWPEGAVPTYIAQDINALDAIVDYLGPRTLILGTTRFTNIGESQREYFNSLMVIDKTATRSSPLSIYDKHRLVPFGELPAAEIIPFGRALSAVLPDAMSEMATNGFSTGAGPSIVTAEGVPPFVPLICYEALFPEISRTANLTERAEWLVQVSSDAWFGGGMGPAQHYAQNRYRAIETGLPLVRSASRGDSAIVDPFGREIMHAAPGGGAPGGWSTSYGRGKLPLPTSMTVFQHRIGALLFWLTSFVFLGVAFMFWRR